MDLYLERPGRRHRAAQRRAARSPRSEQIAPRTLAERRLRALVDGGRQPRERAARDDHDHPAGRHTRPSSSSPKRAIGPTQLSVRCCSPAQRRHLTTATSTARAARHQRRHRHARRATSRSTESFSPPLFSAIPFADPTAYAHDAGRRQQADQRHAGRQSRSARAQSSVRRHFGAARDDDVRRDRRRAHARRHRRRRPPHSQRGEAAVLQRGFAIQRASISF